MRRQWIGMGLVLAATVCLSACGPKTPVKHLVMGTSAEFPPFEMMGGADNSAVVGFDVEIARAIASRVDMPLQVEEMDFDKLLPALAAGEVDLVLAGLTITDARAQIVDFSDPYYTSTQVVLIRRGDPVPESKADLKDRKIGAQLETTSAEAALALAGKRNFREYVSGLKAVVGLMNSRVDFVLIDEQPAIHFQKAHAKDLQLVRLDFEEEHYGVAVQKGNAALLAQVNAVLAKMVRDGRYEQWVERWMVQVPEAAAAAEE